MYFSLDFKNIGEDFFNCLPPLSTLHLSFSHNYSAVYSPITGQGGGCVESMVKLGFKSVQKSKQGVKMNVENKNQ